jgi:hypothetical protein
MKLLAGLAAVIMMGPVAASPNCDDALGGGLCPDAFSLSEMGDCLVAKKNSVDENCALYIDINSHCASALARCGDGIQWSPDSILCVTTWTKSSELAADCADAVAKIPSETAPDKDAKIDEEDETPEQKKKREKRKADRKRAANDVGE